MVFFFFKSSDVCREVVISVHEELKTLYKIKISLIL